MPGDPLKHVQPGDQFDTSAARSNLLSDAGRDFLRRQGDVDHDTQREIHRPGVVLLKNDSGSDRSRFEILGLDSAIFSPTENLDSYQNQLAEVGKTPASPEHLGKFAILLEPIPDKQLGEALVAGIVAVTIDVTHEDIDRADIKDGDGTVLQTHLSGSAFILDKESGTGEKRARVRLGNMPEISYWGTLDEDLVAGSSATVSIWLGDPLADSGENITAYASFLMASGTIKADIRVRVVFDKGKWYVVDHNQAMLVQATVNMGGGLNTTDPTITVDAAVVMVPIGGQLASALTSIDNTFSWEADDNAIVIGAWNQNDASFDAIQVECPA